MSSVKNYINEKDAQISLYLGDCVIGMREHLSDNSVDVVVTSPPYNLGVAYNGYDDSLPRERYLRWMDVWAGEVKRVMSEDGSLFLNVGSKPTDPLVPFQILTVMNQHFAVQNVIHWVKSIAIMKSEVGNYPGITRDIVVGHYKPINSGRFLHDCHEYIFHLTKHAKTPLDRLAVGVPYQDKTNLARYTDNGTDIHCRGNTWFIPYETIQNRNNERPHPATFPVELPKRCMQLHGIDRARMVMDPFLGIGSSAIAAISLGLPFTGFEISPEYFNESRERIDRYCASKSVCNLVCD